jgi:hypothetical protein
LFCFVGFFFVASAVINEDMKCASVDLKSDRCFSELHAAKMGSKKKEKKRQKNNCLKAYQQMTGCVTERCEHTQPEKFNASKTVKEKCVVFWLCAKFN